jgi:hypothetical protein
MVKLQEQACNKVQQNRWVGNNLDASSMAQADFAPSLYPHNPLFFFSRANMLALAPALTGRVHSFLN